MGLIDTAGLKNSMDLIKVILIGQNGTGKSIFASGFPTPGAVFDFDKGIRSYKNIDNWDTYQYDISDGKEWFQLNKDRLKVEADVKAGRIKTIIVDSTTTLSELAMRHAIFLNPKTNEFGGPKFETHYTGQKSLIKDFIRELVGLDVNLVVTCHIKVVADEIASGVLASPALTGQLGTELLSFFDEIWYMRPKEISPEKTEWRIQTQRSGRYPARSRLAGVDGLLDTFEKADYEVIKQKVERSDGD